jgi:hypothetical protein
VVTRLRGAGLWQGGELLNNDLWACAENGRGQRVGIERVDNHRLGSLRPQVRCSVLAPSRTHHVVTGLEQTGDERPTDSPGRAGDEDLHPRYFPRQHRTARRSLPSISPSLAHPSRPTMTLQASGILSLKVSRILNRLLSVGV